jgi:hypothetical protein
MRRVPDDNHLRIERAAERVICALPLAVTFGGLK